MRILADGLIVSALINSHLWTLIDLKVVDDVGCSHARMHEAGGAWEGDSARDEAHIDEQCSHSDKAEKTVGDSSRCTLPTDPGQIRGCC